MSVTRAPREDGRHGLTSREKQDPIGFAVAALNRLAQAPALDRFGLRRPAERVVFEATRSGFRTAGAVSRRFSRAKVSGRPTRAPAAAATGSFDLTPTEDEQMLVDVVRELAAEVVRPAAAAADESAAAPATVLAAGLEIGLPLLGVPEELGGISAERSAMAGTLVAEALAHGDMGLAVAMPGARRGEHRALPVGRRGPAGDVPPGLHRGPTCPRPPSPSPSRGRCTTPCEPRTTARRDGDGYVLEGVKSMVPRGADAELFVDRARSSTARPALFLVESDTTGLTIEAEPSMGLRAASLSRVVLDDVTVGDLSLLGSAEDYVECVRLSRLGLVRAGPRYGEGGARLRDAVRERA